MTSYLNRAGTFKAKPIEWSVRKNGTGSISLSVIFETREVRNGEMWSQLPSGLVRGDFVVVKSTGASNDKVAEMLCITLGWGGSFGEVTSGPPYDSIVQIDVESEDYKGKTYYKAKWIRVEHDDSSGPNAPLDAGTLGDLDKVHGASLRKIAAEAKAKAPVVAPPVTEAPATEYGDIPF